MLVCMASRGTTVKYFDLKRMHGGEDGVCVVRNETISIFLSKRGHEAAEFPSPLRSLENVQKKGDVGFKKKSLQLSNMNGEN